MYILDILFNFKELIKAYFYGGKTKILFDDELQMLKNRISIRIKAPEIKIRILKVQRYTPVVYKVL